MPNGIQQYTKLENRLVLLAWLTSLLGYQSNRELLEDCRSVAEGFGADGRSFLYHHLIARGRQVKVPPAKLAEYDENIRQHLEKINCRRTEKITLRYFQHLAALCTEIFLDRLFNAQVQLLSDLNTFVAERNASRLPGEPRDTLFAEGDLTKLAYWMATGSGKTLLLHLNYHQFLHYNREPLDNILLITPNEGLSEQHLTELAASDIPAQRFNLKDSGLWTGGQRVVHIIEITKLVEEKRGSGISVPVEAFEGRNLIFVDEGHKGSGGEAWRKYREALSADGFTFEYSATFGQALSAARNDPLTEEYGKAIAFDYSYKYFYGDGFGKDFRVLNLRNETRDAQTDLLLLGNLLSFYEQLRMYQTQANALRPYNLEKPLWVFVGSTVNAVYSENRQPRSDVLTVARFFHRVLRDPGWVQHAIAQILEGKTGLSAPDGSDIFLGRFPTLRAAGLNAAAIYEDIVSRLFHASTGGGLHLVEIKRASGELGLKAAGATHYFGVIYIGDVSDFRELVQQDPSGIALEQDAISDSLFAQVNQPDAPIHVLIGARKFIEGWNSWRVSSMGLLNIGRNEGAQIIQLFGRGVRLKGKDWCLKRSSALPGEHPSHINLLETLNIFAVRANYMAQFRNYLEREGVEVEPPIELPLFAVTRRDFLDRGLVIPRPAPDADFASHESLLLEADPKVSVVLDLSVRVQAIQSTNVGIHTTQAQAGQAQALPKQSLDLVDWQQVYLDVLAHKQQRGMINLIVRPAALREIAEMGACQVIAEPNALIPDTLESWTQLQHVVTRLLCLYTDAFYRARREAWEADHALVYQPLSKDDPNLSFNLRQAKQKYYPSYVLRISRSETQLIQQIKRLQTQLFDLYRREVSDPPRLCFDRHLYIPLLLEDARIEMTPPGLRASEAQFVRDLRTYWEQHQATQLAGKHLFLLRNLSRGKGIGFFEGRGFYPDFILWILDPQSKAQRILFVEPHGMLHAKAYIHDEKARLWERLPQLAGEIAKRSPNAPPVSLDAYIVSATPYDELYSRYDDGTWDRAKFAKHHILFQERTNGYDYIAHLLK